MTADRDAGTHIPHRSEEDEARAAAAGEGLHVTDLERSEMPDGTVQYVAEEAPRRSPADERTVVLCLVGASVAGVISVVAGLRRLDAVQGASVAVALLLVAVALIVIATRLLPHQVTVQGRHALRDASSDAALARPERSTSASNERAVLSRRLLLGSLLAAGGAISAALLVSLRGIGPGADASLRRTGWDAGVRAVDVDGRLVRAEDVPLGGVLTVFPATAPGSADGQTLVMRLPTAALTAQTAAAGTAEGLVAYSKICSHAGCPVGQLQVDVRGPDTTYRLLCPCHQSLFDVTDIARPLSGPASRPLAQLPIGTDEFGVIVALADFDTPVGPGWWSA